MQTQWRSEHLQFCDPSTPTKFCNILFDPRRDPTHPLNSPSSYSFLCPWHPYISAMSCVFAILRISCDPHVWFLSFNMASLRTTLQLQASTLCFLLRLHSTPSDECGTILLSCACLWPMVSSVAVYIMSVTDMLNTSLKLLGVYNKKQNIKVKGNSMLNPQVFSGNSWIYIRLIFRYSVHAFASVSAAIHKKGLCVLQLSFAGKWLRDRWMATTHLLWGGAEEKDWRVREVDLDLEWKRSSRVWRGTGPDTGLRKADHWREAHTVGNRGR